MGRITVRLVSSLTGLDLTKQVNLVFFECTETTKSKPVKQESSETVWTSPKGEVYSGLYFVVFSPLKVLKFTANSKYR